jgi:hypothetical protein
MSDPSPEKFVTMLEQHCEKLEVIENALYSLATDKDGSGDLKTIELWLQSQTQLRITSLELRKQLALCR